MEPIPTGRCVGPSELVPTAGDLRRGSSRPAAWSRLRKNCQGHVVDSHHLAGSQLSGELHTRYLIHARKIKWWSRGESDSRPEEVPPGLLRACPAILAFRLLGARLARRRHSWRPALVVLGLGGQDEPTEAASRCLRRRGLRESSEATSRLRPRERAGPEPGTPGRCPWQLGFDRVLAWPLDQPRRAACRILFPVETSSAPLFKDAGEGRAPVAIAAFPLNQHSPA